MKWYKYGKYPVLFMQKMHLKMYNDYYRLYSFENGSVLAVKSQNLKPMDESESKKYFESLPKHAIEKYIQTAVKMSEISTIENMVNSGYISVEECMKFCNDKYKIITHSKSETSFYHDNKTDRKYPIDDIDCGQLKTILKKPDLTVEDFLNNC